MKIAVPAGRLFRNALGALPSEYIEFGAIEPDSTRRCYNVPCTMPGVSLNIFKARAIPMLVALGTYDAGFCGNDLLEEAAVGDQALAVVDIEANPVRIVVAAAHADFLKSPPKRPLVIATEYPRMASAWAMRKGLAHVILQTWGTTEAYGLTDADIIVDCVDTGKTLQANGLVELAEIGRSSTHLLVNRRKFEAGALTEFISSVQAPKATSACVVATNENGELLTVHTTRNNRGYGLPGGLVDHGETPAETAVRELLEETGLEVVGDTRLIYMGRGQTRYSACYAVHTKGTLRSSDEGIAAWSDPSVVVAANSPYRHFNTLALRAAGVAFKECV